MELETFDQWAILEMMGHIRLGGRVTEEQRFGGTMGRIDIPDSNGGFVTQYFGPSAVFRLTPTTEEIARAVAEKSMAAPINRWEFPQLHEPKMAVDIRVTCQNCGASREVIEGYVEHCPNCHDDEYEYGCELPFE